MIYPGANQTYKKKRLIKFYDFHRARIMVYRNILFLLLNQDRIFPYHEQLSQLGKNLS